MLNIIKHKKKESREAHPAEIAILCIIVATISLVICFSYIQQLSEYYDPLSLSSSESNTESNTLAVIGNTSSSSGNETASAGSTNDISDGSKGTSESNRSANPYHGLARICIDVGSKFAYTNSYTGYDGSSIDGIMVQVEPGGTITLPKVNTRKGYYLVGWSQGGVQYDPDWDSSTRTITISDDTSNGKNATIYAVYTDDYGNGYCTCGAYAPGIYKDKMDEIKNTHHS